MIDADSGIEDERAKRRCVPPQAVKLSIARQIAAAYGACLQLC
jgi:hypothetical protein